VKQHLEKENISDSTLSRLLAIKAENNLIQFLESIRNPNCKEEEIEEQSSIDFALLKLYLQRLNSDSTVENKLTQMIKNKNNCLIPPDSKVFVKVK
jgi:hypothetical protein